MASDRSTLFRPEVARARTDRLPGSVNISNPIKWQIVTALLAFIVAATAIFLSLASYARVETVRGVVALDKGVVEIVPSRPGILTSLNVEDGDRVEAGQVLAEIKLEDNLLGGGQVSSGMDAATRDQENLLAAQRGLLRARAKAERGRLEAQIAGLNEELQSLSNQIADQKRLIEVAQGDLEKAQTVAVDGFITRRDIDLREATLLSRRQQLSQLQQNYSNRLAAISIAQETIAESQIAVETDLANTRSSQALLAQQAIRTDTAKGYALVSPVEGTVTARTARLGQWMQQGSLMTIVPSDATPIVELYVPSSAAGFIDTGQTLRVAVDAFPYAQFGTVDAVIDEISRTTLPTSGSENDGPAYLVTGRLSRPWIDAFGKRQYFTPGMSLTARIVIEQRSLFEWLFEPLYAIQRRS